MSWYATQVQKTASPFRMKSTMYLQCRFSGDWSLSLVICRFQLQFASLCILRICLPDHFAHTAKVVINSYLLWAEQKGSSVINGEILVRLEVVFSYHLRLWCFDHDFGIVLVGAFMRLCWLHTWIGTLSYMCRCIVLNQGFFVLRWTRHIERQTTSCFP